MCIFLNDRLIKYGVNKPSYQETKTKGFLSKHLHDVVIFYLYNLLKDKIHIAGVYR